LYNITVVTILFPTQIRFRLFENDTIICIVYKSNNVICTSIERKMITQMKSVWKNY